MNIKITGASGYLGNIIGKQLKANGHTVSGIQRSLLYGPVGNLQQELSNTNVVINLAGAPILQRWTAKNKAVILNSRTETTSLLVEAINGLPKAQRPQKFITASAVGIYKTGAIHTESSHNFDPGFLGKVVSQWEDASSHLHADVQRIVFRLAMVLGKKAKTISSLKLPFQLGLGATLGKGDQPFPFVHETDVANAFAWAVNKFEGSETFNLAAPESCSNKEFTKMLAKKMRRPAIFSIPTFVLKAVLGEASCLLTEGPVVVPENLVKAGFVFHYPDIDEALEEIV